MGQWINNMILCTFCLLYSHVLTSATQNMTHLIPFEILNRTYFVSDADTYAFASSVARVCNSLDDRLTEYFPENSRQAKALLLEIDDIASYPGLWLCTRVDLQQGGGPKRRFRHEEVDLSLWHPQYQSVFRLSWTLDYCTFAQKFQDVPLNNDLRMYLDNCKTSKRFVCVSEPPEDNAVSTTSALQTSGISTESDEVIIPEETLLSPVQSTETPYSFIFTHELPYFLTSMRLEPLTSSMQLEPDPLTTPPHVIPTPSMTAAGSGISISSTEPQSWSFTSPTSSVSVRMTGSGQWPTVTTPVSSAPSWDHVTWTQTPSPLNQTDCCRCLCPDPTPKITETELQNLVAQISQNLTVETESLSATVRRKTSAYDPRVSANVSGFFGVIFLTVTFGLVVVIDLTRLITDLSVSHENKTV